MVSLFQEFVTGADFFGQLSDGIFENCRTGNIEELA